MKKFTIVYAPVWGQMTRYVSTIWANNITQAELKFYASNDGNNCRDILSIEQH